MLNRARINIVDNKTLCITEIPYGTNTVKLIGSITKAVKANKLKIKKIDDTTAEHVEIFLHLLPNVSPDQTIDALYAFTDCEIAYATNACVIWDGKPVFTDVKSILRINTENTLNLLRKELEIELQELNDKWHKISLEKIFFEKRIYKELEKDTESWDIQIDNIERAFDPYRPLFKQEITRDHVLALCEKPVRKISKFDIKKAEQDLADIELNIEEVENHLAHIVDYTVNYFKQLKKKYGAGRERRTEIKNFNTIIASEVAVTNQKLYVNKKEGFVGTGLKKDDDVEFACDCSDLDEVIVFREDGKFSVNRVSDKHFYGKNILHVEVFKRGDDRRIYNMVYLNGSNGPAMVKRFAVGGISRDKEYDLTKGKPGSKVLYFTSNPNGEAEVIHIKLRPKPKLKKREFDFDFSSLAVKNRSALGNLLTRYPISSISKSKEGVSTLSAINVYFEESVMRLNNDGRGQLLGAFKEDDKILTTYQSGHYRITGFDISTHFDDDLEFIRKWNSHLVITAVYYQKSEDKYYLKRFNPDNFQKKTEFIAPDPDIVLKGVSIDYLPQIKVVYKEKKKEELSEVVISCAEFVDVMTARARGKRINFPGIKSITFIEPLPYEEPVDEESEEIDEEDHDSSETVEDMDYAIAKAEMEDITVEPLEKSEPGTGEQMTLDL